MCWTAGGRGLPAEGFEKARTPAYEAADVAMPGAACFGPAACMGSAAFKAVEAAATFSVGPAGAEEDASPEQAKEHQRTAIPAGQKSFNLPPRLSIREIDIAGSCQKAMLQ